jgi:peptide/nickel transport system permease protein
VNYFLRRLVYTAFILLVVSFLTSMLLELIPGNPAYAIIGDGATPQQVAILDHQLHLDEGVFPRYLTWLGHAVTGNLGTSITASEPVTTLIRQAAPITIELIILSQLIALFYAFGTAIYSAYRPSGLLDRISGVISFGSISIPTFVLAVFLVLLFAVKLHWVPVASYTPLTQDLGQNLRSMVLPALTVAAAPAGIYQRLLRSDVTATLHEDFIAMAEAKGLSTARILTRHSIRPSLFSVMTLIGLTMAQALGGSVIVESMFGLPGLGALLINSINQRDYVTVQGLVIVIALAYVAVNFLLDYLYGVVDPRVRANRGR